MNIVMVRTFLRHMAGFQGTSDMTQAYGPSCPIPSHPGPFPDPPKEPKMMKLKGGGRSRQPLINPAEC